VCGSARCGIIGRKEAMEFVQQLKSGVDIVRSIGEYVELHRSGPNRYLGLCPFHQETTPSFNVHGLHQFSKCFSCGAGGDVISFYEALQSLSERYGIAMPKRLS
jgi:DNA primase